MCHNPFFLKLPTVTAKKNPAEAVTKNKRFLILTHNKKNGLNCATTSKTAGNSLKVQLTSHGEQEGHPTAGDPFHLTSLYIIPLIKTTVCQQDFNKSSVNLIEVLMSHCRKKTESSKTFW